MVQKTRRELQRIFKSGAKPSSEDFKDFIESTLNITDDGLEKSAGANSPLKISAQGPTEKLLDFYVDEVKTWSISQKLSQQNPGFNLSNTSGNKLFIADSNGNVGINTISPTAKLQIQQTGSDDTLRIVDDSNNTSQFIVKGDGKVGIGTTSPTAKLQINGDLKLESGVAVREFSTDGTLNRNSDLVIPTEKAVRSYIQNNIPTYTSDKASLTGSSSQDFSTKDLFVNGDFRVAEGNNVQGIPIIDFQTKTWSFANHRDSSKRVEVTFTFPHPVIKVSVISASWSLFYSSNQSIKEVGIMVPSPTVSGSTVIAKLDCRLKDNSGYYDDTYNGSGHIVVIAMMNKAITT